jgi:hypothetical protein
MEEDLIFWAFLLKLLEMFVFDEDVSTVQGVICHKGGGGGVFCTAFVRDCVGKRKLFPHKISTYLKKITIMNKVHKISKAAQFGTPNLP